MKNTETRFKATHTLNHDGRRIPVRKEEGHAGGHVLYTRGEWESASLADWEQQPDAAVTFQGRPTGATLTPARGKATLVLGRDGMGPEADEADFNAWVSYVCEHIDAATGLDVDVKTRGARDVQDDAIQGTDDPQPIHDAVQSLWDDFCADESAWPARLSDSDETRDCLGLSNLGRTPDNEP